MKLLFIQTYCFLQCAKSDLELWAMQSGSSAVSEDGWKKRGPAYLQAEVSGQPLTFRKLLSNRPVVRKESARSRKRKQKQQLHSPETTEQSSVRCETARGRRRGERKRNSESLFPGRSFLQLNWHYVLRDHSGTDICPHLQNKMWNGLTEITNQWEDWCKINYCIYNLLVYVPLKKGLFAQCNPKLQCLF